MKGQTTFHIKNFKSCHLKNPQEARAVILATWEAEIRKIMVQNSLGINKRTYLKDN
jgi:hypothetical protein